MEMNRDYKHLCSVNIEHRLRNVINTTAITIIQHLLHNLHSFSTVEGINSLLFSQHKHQTGLQSIYKNITKLNYL